MVKQASAPATLRFKIGPSFKTEFNGIGGLRAYIRIVHYAGALLTLISCGLSSVAHHVVPNRRPRGNDLVGHAHLDAGRNRLRLAGR